jgi:hypothetical protein
VGEPLCLTASISRPGFVRVTCTAYNSEYGAIGGFDVLEAGAGAEVEKLSYCDTVPEDFDKYWGDVEQLVKDFDEKVYFQKDSSDVKTYVEVPFTVKVKSGRACKKALTLVEALAEKQGLQKKSKIIKVDSIQLIKQALI